MTSRYSTSPHIRLAAVILVLNYAATMSLWYFLKGRVGWGYAVIDAATMLFFVHRWTLPNAQHKTLFYLLMCASMVSVSFSAFQWLFKGVYPDVAALSARWYQLIVNVMFLAQLLFVSAYSILRHRAKSDPDRWRGDTTRWLQRLRKD